MTLEWPALPANCIWNYDTTSPDSLVKISIWNADGSTQMTGQSYTDADAYNSTNVEADLQGLIDLVHTTLLAMIEQFEAEQTAAAAKAQKLQAAIDVIETNKPA